MVSNCEGEATILMRGESSFFWMRLRRMKLELASVDVSDETVRLEHVRKCYSTTRIILIVCGHSFRQNFV